MHAAKPCAVDRVAHPGIVGGHDHTLGAAAGGALGDPHDHRLAADVGERLARQARRGVARGNEDGEHPSPAAACGSRSLLRPELARLVLEHHRNAVADRIGEACRTSRSAPGARGRRRADPWSPGRRGFQAVWHPRIFSSTMRPTSAGSSRARTGRYQQRASAKRGAFYRVLLGHQDRDRITETSRSRGDEAMVIREWMRRRVDAQRAQQSEETLRIADAGHRMHRARPRHRRGSAIERRRRADCARAAAPRRRATPPPRPAAAALPA